MPFPGSEHLSLLIRLIGCGYMYPIETSYTRVYRSHSQEGRRVTTLVTVL